MPEMFSFEKGNICLMKFRLTTCCPAHKQSILSSVNAKQGRNFDGPNSSMKLLGISSICDTLNNVASTSVHLSPFTDFACLWVALLFILFLSGGWLILPLSTLSVCFSRHGEGKDYPSSGFLLDREWAAFELSLTEASSHSQAVHEARVAHTCGVSCKEGDVRDREKREVEGEKAQAVRQEIKKTRASALEAENWSTDSNLWGLVKMK